MAPETRYPTFYFMPFFTYHIDFKNKYPARSGNDWHSYSLAINPFVTRCFLENVVKVNRKRSKINMLTFKRNVFTTGLNVVKLCIWYLSCISRITQVSVSLSSIINKRHHSKMSSSKKNIDDLQRDFAAGVYQYEASSPSRFLFGVVYQFCMF